MVKRRATEKQAAPIAGTAQKLKKARTQSAHALTAQKLRDTYRMCTDEEVDVMVHPQTGLTLRQTLHHDIEEWLSGKDIRWGPGYHELNRKISKQTYTLHEQLTAGSVGASCRRRR